MPAYLKIQHRLLWAAGANSLRIGEHSRKLPSLIPHYRQVGAGNTMNSEVAPVQLSPHRGRAKGNTAAVDDHYRILALPAVALDFRIENTNFRAGFRPGPQKAKQPEKGTNSRASGSNPSL